MKAIYPLIQHAANGSAHEIKWAHSSNLRALPSGIRKQASAHPTVYFMDKAAHIPGAEATLNIAQPAVRQIIAVSSVAPGWFADTCGCLAKDFLSSQWCCCGLAVSCAPEAYHPGNTHRKVKRQLEA